MGLEIRGALSITVALVLFHLVPAAARSDERTRAPEAGPRASYSVLESGRYAGSTVPVVASPEAVAPTRYVKTSQGIVGTFERVGDRRSGRLPPPGPRRSCADCHGAR